jgi:hypothetical protein
MPSHRALHALRRDVTAHAQVRARCCHEFLLAPELDWPGVFDWIWTQGLRWQHRTPMKTMLTYMYGFLFDPKGHGRTGALFQELFAALVVARSLGHFIHFAGPLHASTRRSPRWLSRVCRLLAPDWLDTFSLGLTSQLCWDSVAQVRCVVHRGLDTYATSSNYIWFCNGTEYVGKTDLLRKNGSTGFAARIFEHYNLLARPHLRDAKKPRYKLFRLKSVGELFFMPLLLAEDAKTALASESLAIALTRPRGNAADRLDASHDGRFGGNAGTVLRNISKGLSRIRRRPPKHLREAYIRRLDQGASSVLRSIWSHGSVLSSLAHRERKRQHGLPNALLIDAPFDTLYALQLYDFRVHTGLFGPLNIYDPERRMLWMAYLAKFGGRIRFDARRGLDWWARHLYWSSLHLGLLQTRGRRVLAGRTIDFCLRALALPPRNLPVITVPCQAVSELRAPLRGALRALCDRLRPPAAAAWVRAHVRIVVGGAVRWTSEINSQKFGHTFEKEKFFATWDSQTFQRVLDDPQLHGIDGPWRLPRWPTDKFLIKTLAQCWRDFAERLDVPERHPRAYQASVGFILNSLPTAPPRALRDGVNRNFAWPAPLPTTKATLLQKMTRLCLAFGLSIPIRMPSSCSMA